MALCSADETSYGAKTKSVNKDSRTFKLLKFPRIFIFDVFRD